MIIFSRHFCLDRETNPAQVQEGADRTLDLDPSDPAVLDCMWIRNSGKFSSKTGNDERTKR